MISEAGGGGGEGALELGSRRKDGEFGGEEHRDIGSLRLLLWNLHFFVEVGRKNRRFWSTKGVKIRCLNRNQSFGLTKLSNRHL